MEDATAADVSASSSSISSIASSVVSSASSTASTVATSATAAPEKTEEEKKKEEEEEKKRKEKEAQSARCSKIHYQEVDGETPFAPFCNPRDGQDWTAGQSGFYQSKILPYHHTTNPFLSRRNH